MNYFDLRQMTKEELITYLKRLSAAYVPEWHMQTEEPDVGSALALIFADMYGDLIQKSIRIPDKHYIDFLNLQEPVQKSSKGAQGFITLTLSEGTRMNVPVAKGKQLIGTDINQEAVVFETAEDVLLTPVKLEAVFLLDSLKDSLAMPFDISTQSNVASFFMMPDQFVPNLQCHILELHHTKLLNLKRANAIEICFKNTASSVEGRALLLLLSSKESVSWQYQEAGKWLDFECVELLSEGIRLSNLLPICLESPVIRLELKEPSHLTCEGFKLRPICDEHSADVLYANEIEVPQIDGYMFGTQYYAYDAFYIASEEVFTKPGSQVSLSLEYILEAFPLPFEIPEPKIKWKNVLRKSDLPEIKENNILISDLALEYWNGLGWAKLETIEFDPTMFACELGEYQNKTIRFICPEDMTVTHVGASSNIWIRLRIMRVDHAYTMSGNYYAPKIKRLKLQYAFLDAGKIPERLVRNEFMTATEIDTLAHIWTLFSGYGELTGSSIYLMFDEKFEGAPIQILFEIGTVLGKTMAKFRWEMLKSSAGTTRWEPIEVVDNTYHFTQTGILTLIGDSRQEKTVLFGKSGYWLRAIEVEAGELPVLIKGIFCNSVAVIQKETMISQYFDLKSHEYNKVMQLNHKQLESIQVWVNEPQLSDSWLKANHYEYQKMLSADGTVEGKWVKWQPVEAVVEMDAHTRGYLVDMYEGILTFGDSVHGYLPEQASHSNLRVDYAVNKGHLGNVGALSITRLAEAVPNVNKIYNPLELIGGKPPESRRDALIRTANSLHHQYRVKTLKDLDDLLMATAYEIREVLTLQNTNPEGQYQLGMVTSAVHTKRPIYQRDYFRKLKQHLYKDMLSKLPCTLMAERNYFIVEPQPVTIDVHFSGIIESMDQYLFVSDAITKTITQYLETYTGNRHHMGWHIGELPDVQYLLSMLQSITGLKAVSHLVMNAVVQSGYETIEVSLKHLKTQPFIVVQNGRHTIHLDL